jgi:sterol desaturase/sphingolipid hydroxylase (fatty acid hydroxylase superfamily)
MLGFLIPDALQRLFVQMVSGVPLALQFVAFALLCAAFLVAASWILRRGLLYLDAELATRSQRQTTQIGLPAQVAGWVAQWQWRLIVVGCAAMVTATTAFSVSRGANVDPNSGVYSTIRLAHICLLPNSGNGDSMVRCTR